MEKRKPLVLVHEADPSKGGLSMEGVWQDCPADLQDFILHDRTPIQWHRVAEYQSVCLKQIALATLEACPGMRKAQTILSGGLYFKGELTAYKMHFRRPVTILVSDDNPGAEDLAMELTNTFKNVSIASATESVADTGLPTALTRSSSWQLADSVFFMLYLNEKTFVGEPGVRLAAQIRATLNYSKHAILLVHENEKALGGCEFSRFFEVTPEDLIATNLYGEIAIAFHGPRNLDSPSLTSPFRQVSYALTAQKLGAIKHRGVRKDFRRPFSRDVQHSEISKAPQRPLTTVAADVAPEKSGEGIIYV